MRVHRVNISDERPAPSAFREHGGGMSTDWAKYRTPEQTLAAARIPNDNGVVGLIVGQVRQIPLEVTHTPIVENQAHTDVTKFDNLAEARLKLARIAFWMINWPRGQ
jgi:hypothetical protein